MKTKIVQETDDISLILDNTFIMCKSSGKGMVKKDLSKLQTNDYSFLNVITMIENMNHDELIAVDLDCVLFEKGLIVLSEKVDELVKLEVAVKVDAVSRSFFYNIKKIVNRYFKEYPIAVVETEIRSNNTTSQKIF